MIHNIENTYSPSHPWYYLLGGRVLMPKEILRRMQRKEYNGWDYEKIEKADLKIEPQRSEQLRQLRKIHMLILHQDLIKYREVARELRANRALYSKAQENILVCLDIHTALSLKHNHLCNDFAHLYKIDMLLAQQPDLFEF